MNPCAGALVAAALAGACATASAGLEPVELARAWPVMGTLFEARAVAPDSASAREALAAARAQVFRVDSLMSTYKPRSEISRLNAAAGTGAWTGLSAETIEVLGAALDWAQRSGGAFDPTVGPLVDLWGFHRSEGRVPSAAELDSVRLAVGWEAVELDFSAGGARLPRSGMGLDFGAIAKGYALDRAAAAMRAAGAEAGMVDLGGQVLVFGGHPSKEGQPAGGRRWPLGIRHPRRSEELLGRIVVNGGSVATSGDNERFFEHEGVRYSHIIDPGTGWPARGVAQVTVAAATGMLADALSTALFVLGPDRGRGFLARWAPGATAVWVLDSGAGEVSADDILVAGPDSTQVEIRVPTSTEPQPLTEPRMRTYYIAAEEVTWDYAPTDSNQITGDPFGPHERMFVARGADRIGDTYLKALYRAYSDSTFTTPVPRPPEWEHLGALGPLIRAVTGDTIRLVFRNRTRFPFSLHPHGVFYLKDSEGVPGNDETSGRDTLDDRVSPGGVHTYVWPVPERAGPGPNDPSSVVWFYHSHVDEPGDANAGLIGPIVVTARGKARADGSPVDVDREFVTLFKIYDENRSPYLAENIAAYAESPDEVDPDDEGFIESNLLHAINGTVYGNLPLLTMRAGERVRWYLLGLGNEADVHTAHWHGNTVLQQGIRTDVVHLLPASMAEIDMVPDNPGIWIFQCHVDDHMMGGMQVRYRVLPAGPAQ